MIDWLELLWQAAEEGQAVRLPDPAAPMAEGGIRRDKPEEGDFPMTLEGGEDITAALTALRVPFEGAYYSRETLPGTAQPGTALLYRRVREAAAPLPAPGSLRGERGRVEEEISLAPPLTEGALDRAMRRDSRRYDSGMTIY
jgi:hypothetical protein